MALPTKGKNLEKRLRNYDGNRLWLALSPTRASHVAHSVFHIVVLGLMPAMPEGHFRRTAAIVRGPALLELGQRARHDRDLARRSWSCCCGRSGLPLLAVCPNRHRRTVPFRLVRTLVATRRRSDSCPFKCRACGSPEVTLYAIESQASWTPCTAPWPNHRSRRRDRQPIRRAIQLLDLSETTTDGRRRGHLICYCPTDWRQSSEHRPCLRPSSTAPGRNACASRSACFADCLRGQLLQHAHTLKVLPGSRSNTRLNLQARMCRQPCATSPASGWEPSTYGCASAWSWKARPNGTVRLLRFMVSRHSTVSLPYPDALRGKIVGKALETINNRFQVAYVVRSPTEISVTARTGNQFAQTGSSSANRLRSERTRPDVALGRSPIRRAPTAGHRRTLSRQKPTKAAGASTVQKMCGTSSGLAGRGSSVPALPASSGLPWSSARPWPPLGFIALA